MGRGRGSFGRALQRLADQLAAASGLLDANVGAVLHQGQGGPSQRGITTVSVSRPASPDAATPALSAEYA